MKKDVYKFVKISYGLNIFFAGIITGYFLFGWGLFTIKYEIDLVAVLGIIVAAIIAIYITERIAKRNTENRVEKDLLIGKVVVVDADYDQMFSNFNNSRYNVSETIATTDSIAAKVQTIGKLAKKCDFLAIANFQKLSAFEKEFRDYLTNTTASNDAFVYSDAQIIKVEDTYDSIKEVLAELVIELNRI